MCRVGSGDNNSEQEGLHSSPRELKILTGLAGWGGHGNTQLPGLKRNAFVLLLKGEIE